MCVPVHVLLNKRKLICSTVQIKLCQLIRRSESASIIASAEYRDASRVPNVCRNVTYKGIAQPVT